MHAKIDTNMQVIEYPIMNIRLYLPNISLPVDLTKDSDLPTGFVYVNTSVLPDFDKSTQTVKSTNPVYDGTKWNTHYDVIQLTPDGLKQNAASLRTSITGQVTQFINAAATKLGYDSISVAVSYADEQSVPKFQIEGTALRAWRSAVWAYYYTQLDLVDAGTRTLTTAAAMIAELPVLHIPS